MEKVKVVTDYSGHWYVIPNDLFDEFKKDSENIDMEDSGEFDEKYSKFRTGGSLNNTQLYAEVKNSLPPTPDKPLP